MSFEFEWEVERDDGDYDLYTFEVEYGYTPGCPPVYYYPDGSGDPGCSPEIELEEVRLIGVEIEGKKRKPTPQEEKEWEVKFTKYVNDNWDTFYDLCCDDVERAEKDAEADYWERQYDEMHDEGLI